MPELATQILDFWFGQVEPDGTDKRWFQSSAAHDQRIAERFGEYLDDARRGKLDSWGQAADSWLAYILLTDQFPRNIFRGRTEAFAYDDLALSMARHGLQRGFDQALHPIRRVFAYLPFEHSESRQDQDLCCVLMSALQAAAPPESRDSLQASMAYALAHRDIIVRFGRFPHRNAVLGRTSSDDERRYLESATRFGQ